MKELSSDPIQQPLDSAIEISNLSYGYTSHWLRRHIPILHNLSLTISAGECFGFLGHNGAGKTTTIRCLLGLLSSTPEAIKIFGTPATEPAARKPIGYLPEQPYFYDHLTVLELVSYHAALAGIPRENLPDAVDLALNRAKIVGRKSSKLRSLSKGLLQRVALAQAIVARPKLLILDEPFSGLDPVGRKEFKELLFELKSEGATIFMASHILSDVELLCDRVSILSQGRLKGVFKTAELPGLMETRYEITAKLPPERLSDFEELKHCTGRGDLSQLTFSSSPAAQKALTQLVNQGAEIVVFKKTAGNLEDLFVSLVNYHEGQT